MRTATNNIVFRFANTTFLGTVTITATRGMRRSHMQANPNANPSEPITGKGNGDKRDNVINQTYPYAGRTDLRFSKDRPRPAARWTARGESEQNGLAMS